ncbi:PIN domain-containing protein [Halobaculum sp. MBLA0143]|uniref:PIN domain-containing protein n=1 Tax=Halobaculum sp. MBLA0143 TaxID=3079933 RepID=UPI003523CECE
MPRAVVDTTVLFAAAYRRDESHDRALSVMRGFDDGTLPEVIVLDYVLAETINGITTHAGHDAAIDFLDRVESSTRFHLDSPTANCRAKGKALFRQHEPLSFVDACIVAYMETTGLDYLYALDDDFDAVEGVRRLATPANPYDPNEHE